MKAKFETDGTRTYLAGLEEYPLLTRKQEKELAVRYRDMEDELAKQTLITSNLRFVIKVALGYRNYGLNLMDLVQEGNVGLIKAVERFDPDRGYRLITYAIWWIKAYIRNFIMRSWSLVKVGTTQAQRKLFHRFSELPDPGDGDRGRENAARLAERTGVTEDDVIDMAARLKARDVSLDHAIGDGSTNSFVDTLRDDSPDQENVLGRQEELHDLKQWAGQALTSLSSRERYIVERRVLSEETETLKELGKHFSISRERARQIEKAALNKLRADYLRSRSAAA